MDQPLGSRQERIRWAGSSQVVVPHARRGAIDAPKLCRYMSYVVVWNVSSLIFHIFQVPARAFYLLWVNILGPWFFAEPPPEMDEKKAKKMERKMKQKQVVRRWCPFYLPTSYKSWSWPSWRKFSCNLFQLYFWLFVPFSLLQSQILIWFPHCSSLTPWMC